MAAGFTDWVPRLSARSASYFIASAGRFERLQVFDTLADTHTPPTYYLPTHLPPFLPTYLYLLTYLLTYLHTHTPNLGYAAACPMPIRRPVPSENQPQNNLIIIIIIGIDW